MRATAPLLLAAFFGSYMIPALIQAQDSEPEEIPITILFTSALYGRFTEVDCRRSDQVSDFANLVAAIDTVRSQLSQRMLPAALVVGGGDNIGPHAFARFVLSDDRPGADLMAGWLKRAGYDLLGLARQEFYTAPERLRHFLEAGRSKGLFFSAANLDCLQSEEVLNNTASSAVASLCPWLGLEPQRYRIFRRGGLKIAMFSILHGQLINNVPPSHLRGVQLVDPFTRAKELAASARQAGADLVVVLFHLDGSQTSPGHAARLAKSMPEADLIIASGLRLAEDQSGIAVLRFVDLTAPIVGSDRLGQFLGRADLVLRRRRGRWRVQTIQASQLDPSDHLPDQPLRNQLVHKLGSYCEQWDRPVGQGKLSRSMDAATFEEYLMEIMRRITRSELAFINQGLVNLRTVFPLEGVITRHDIFSALPHNNRIYTFSMDGEGLTKLCQKLEKENLAGQSRLLARGLECVDPITINGRRLDSGESYQVVTVEYLAKGMLGYFQNPSVPRVAYRPDTVRSPPVLKEVVRAFLSSPRFTGSNLDPIDLDQNFVDLADKLRWTLEGGLNLNLADTRIDNRPGYEESQLTRDTFVGLKSEVRGKVGASSSLHGFSLELLMKYARSATNDKTFVESEDLTTLNLVYKLNALRETQAGWFLPVLYVEGKAETELTKPDEGRDYHHLELTGTVGARFSLHPKIEAKAGLGVRREMFAPQVKTVYGLDLGYELERCDLFNLLGSPVQVESKLSAFFGDVGRSNTLKAQWTNRLYFVLVGPIFLNVTHELFAYRYSKKSYGLASDLTFGLSYHARTVIQTF